MNPFDFIGSKIYEFRAPQIIHFGLGCLKKVGSEAARFGKREMLRGAGKSAPDRKTIQAAALSRNGDQDADLLIWVAGEGRAPWRVVRAFDGGIVIYKGTFEYGEPSRM